ncbi:recombinase family protein [Anaerobranca gottschalkii]|uniref:Site-specific DNA recombinase n=1 Tax=Anaerobranca gottschalkii DSM 13577 TaxID=1120990 RepID=A0A1I0BA94_9FIRM|nr:recombinase family protein [Anaerobranca gottschalkii]SET03067.1 Site-specific DNA recombinase [Anaerobranca gottschalkii DSM 13577]
MFTIKKIERKIPEKTIQKKRVAAYARVSSGKEEMLHSLSAQISYYSSFIQSHSNWEYVGVYADEGITGTNSNRPEFQRLLTDARKGKIDLIITKSVSRFMRNTVELLEIVRELKSLNVDVYFEKENIHTMSGDGELMLTILASFAQEESRSVSENCKWRIRKNFSEGKLNGGQILGYDLIGDKLEINQNEAKIVQRIFQDFLAGMGKEKIAQRLNEEGIKTKRGNKWSPNSIAGILRNEKYTGQLKLQKTYVSDNLTKKKKKNRGQLPTYIVSENHPKIIDKETFDKVQKELEKRAKRYQPKQKPSKYPLTGLIQCGLCGKNYRRKINNIGTKYQRVIWICSTYNSKGKKECPAKQVPEDILLEENLKDIEKIIVKGDNTLLFIYKNGERRLKDVSKSS